MHGSEGQEREAGRREEIPLISSPGGNVTPFTPRRGGGVFSPAPGQRPPFLGHGAGLRRCHYPDVLSGSVECDWFEVITENFLGAGGRARRILFSIRERFPVVLHGVSLSIGGCDPIRGDYLEALRGLASELEPPWISDHLCFTSARGHNSHDLLPLPYTEESLAHVERRVLQVQDFLGRAIALENASSYVTFLHSTLSEWEFLAELAARTGCGILLDLNNLDVSCHNHGWERESYLQGIPPGSVWQFHLAGPSEMGPLLIDTHDHPVPDRVWELYRRAVRRFGAVSSLVEWDDKIPEWSVLSAERQKAARLMDEELRRGPGDPS